MAKCFFTHSDKYIYIYSLWRVWAIFSREVFVCLAKEFLNLRGDTSESTPPMTHHVRING